MATLVAASKQTDSDSTTLGGGTAGETYLCRLRVRCVCGLIVYSGGTRKGTYLYEGAAATPGTDTINDKVKLEISEPATVYWLNYGTPLLHNTFLDYYFDALITKGATITLSIDNQDSLQWKGDAADALLDCSPLTIFDGIFAQVDLEVDELQGYTQGFGGGARDWVWSGFAENVYGEQAER